VLVQRFAIPAKNATVVVMGALELVIAAVVLVIYLFVLAPATISPVPYESYS
jgi:hypothetical protein